MRADPAAERSRTETVDRLAEAFGFAQPTDLQRLALRGWVGCLECTGLEWIAAEAIIRQQLAELPVTSATALADVVAAHHGSL